MKLSQEKGIKHTGEAVLQVMVLVITLFLCMALARGINWKWHCLANSHIFHFNIDTVLKINNLNFLDLNCQFTRNRALHFVSLNNSLPPREHPPPVQCEWKNLHYKSAVVRFVVSCTAGIRACCSVSHPNQFHANLQEFYTKKFLMADLILLLLSSTELACKRAKTNKNFTISITFL